MSLIGHLRPVPDDDHLQRLRDEHDAADALYDHLLAQHDRRFDQGGDITYLADKRRARQHQERAARTHLYPVGDVIALPRNPPINNDGAGADTPDAA